MTKSILQTTPLTRALRLLCLAAVVVLGFLAATASLAQGAGSVQYVAGSVTILRDTMPLNAMRPMIVNTGDLISTGADGHIHLTMVDRAAISLRPNSQMRIEKYDIDPANPTLGDAMIALVSGTLRVFTGELTRNRDNFKMRTALASLGIRGSGNVLAHFDTTGTINHTLVGAHSVTSNVGGSQRTLVSLAGQTIQVLPGQAPRFIPTPAFILAAASTPTKSGSSEAEKTDGTQTAATMAPATTVTAANPAVAASQGAITAATTATVLANTTVSNVSAYFRSTLPLSGGGFQGVFPQGGSGGAVLNSAGQLVAMPNTNFATFLAGPGALPTGYTAISVPSAHVRIQDGIHRDGYRSADGSVIIGRWEGGTISVADNSQATATHTLYALGARSLAYVVQQATPSGISAAFTGTSVYSMAAASAPTDAAGNAGRLASATVTFNFSSLTAALNASLSINNQNFTLTGSTTFGRGAMNPNWARATPTGPATLDIACTGSNCAGVGYTGVASTALAGANGAFAAGQYRIVPTRQTGSGFSDQITGVFALQAGATPTVGIVLPVSGTTNMIWSGITNAAPTNAVPSLNISGTLQANFSTRTLSFSANVNGVGATAGGALPTYSATATNVPIIGVGFSASTTPSVGVGALTLTCSGATCGTAASRFGRFDGFFSDNTGTRGTTVVSVGDSANNYFGNASFAPGGAPVSAPTAAQLVALDVARMAGGGAFANGALVYGGNATHLRNRALGLVTAER